MPTFTQSAPASARRFAAPSVTIFPAIRGISGNAFLSSATFWMTFSLSPWAESKQSTSTPASINALARGNNSGLAPTAAPTIKRPFASNAGVIPLGSASFTKRTCSAWSSMAIFLWMMDNPPSRARAMAMEDSLTVSIAALKTGIGKSMPRQRWVFSSTWLGTAVE